MSSEMTSYEAALRDLEAERAEIDLLIEALKRRIARASGGTTANGRPGATITDDAFFGMTVADAMRI